MTVTAIWLQEPDYSARLDRQFVETVFGSRQQVFEGLVVTQHSTGDLSVDVSAGRCAVAGDDEPDQGYYVVVVDEDETVVMPAAPGSNKRIDIVGDPSADVMNTWMLMVTSSPDGVPLVLRPVLRRIRRSLTDGFIGATVIDDAARHWIECVCAQRLLDPNTREPEKVRVRTFAATHGAVV